MRLMRLTRLPGALRDLVLLGVSRVLQLWALCRVLRHTVRPTGLVEWRNENVPPFNRDVDPRGIERASDKMPDAVVLNEPEELAPLVRDDGLATEAAPISVLEPDSVVEQPVAACLRRPGVRVDVLAGVTGAKKRAAPMGDPSKKMCVLGVMECNL